MPDFSFLNEDEDETIRINTGGRGGKRPKSSRKQNAGAAGPAQTVASFAVLGLIVWGCVQYGARQTPESFAAADNRMLAVTCAQDHIKGMLKAPATAKWPGAFTGVDTRDHATKQPDGTYVVRSYVDAQNSLGAMIRTQYLVHLSLQQSGNYAVIDARLLE